MYWRCRASRMSWVARDVRGSRGKELRSEARMDEVINHL